MYEPNVSNIDNCRSIQYTNNYSVEVTQLMRDRTLLKFQRNTNNLSNVEDNFRLTMNDEYKTVC